jgi:putative Mn2+ efflux pump MntP
LWEVSINSDFVSFWKILLVAFALGCDAFSVAVGIGAGGVTSRRLFRLSWHFGLFQFLMPILGVLLGHGVSARVGRVGPWIAGGLVIAIGLKMLWDMLQKQRHDLMHPRHDPTRGWTLILLSIATSIDALLVGFSLGLLGVGILYPAVVIGLMALVMTAVGMFLGAGIARSIGRWAEGLGGVVLCLLGIWFMLR